jgi:hypothetical protein
MFANQTIGVGGHRPGVNQPGMRGDDRDKAIECRTLIGGGINVPVDRSRQRDPRTRVPTAGDRRRSHTIHGTLI